MNPIFLTFLNTGMLVIGQTLFKLGTAGKEIKGIHDMILLMFSPLILMAIILYGFTTVLWVYILSKVPLSVAHPIQALAYPVVLIVSAVIFKENVNIFKYIGVIIICLGVYITTR